jgi:phage shock protein PspC (stress-responsive transcriptional regulator)
MKSFIHKLSSRKLWMAIAGVATGIALALGANTSDIQTITGAVTALASVVAYIVAEGKIDAESVKIAIESVQSAAETIGVDE